MTESIADRYATGKRWTSKRKAEVVASVLRGETTVADTLRENEITEEEFAEWCRLYQRHGAGGLRTTYLGHYRND